MKHNRLPDYLVHMKQAIADACSFVENMEFQDFVADKRTQQADVMNLIILGEAAAKAMDNFPEYTNKHLEVPWRSMRGMRNRIAHGYFEIDLQIVWDTVQAALPQLLIQLQDLPTEPNGSADKH